MTQFDSCTPFGGAEVTGLINVNGVCHFRSQAARGKDGIKDGVSEMGTRLDPVPGLPGGEAANKELEIVCMQSG